METPTTVREASERREKNHVILQHGIWIRTDSLSRALEARTPLAGAARAEGYVEG